MNHVLDRGPGVHGKGLSSIVPIGPDVGISRIVRPYVRSNNKISVLYVFYDQ